MHNILKVLKGSFKYACDVVGFIKQNPAIKVTMLKYDVEEKDPAHIMNKELWNTIIVSRDVDVSLVKELIEQSYELTKKTFTKDNNKCNKIREMLGKRRYVKKK